MSTPTTSTLAQAPACSQKSVLRRYGLWIAVAIAASIAAGASLFGLTWHTVGKYLPFALVLACPAMHLFMCRNQKSGGRNDDPAKS